MVIVMEGGGDGGGVDVDSIGAQQVMMMMWV